MRNQVKPPPGVRRKISPETLLTHREIRKTSQTTTRCLTQKDPPEILINNKTKLRYDEKYNESN